MTKHLRAIYENGVFRPLEPVALAEHREVTLFVDDAPSDNLADIAIECFGDEAIDLPPHPAVPVRNAPDLGA